MPKTLDDSEGRSGQSRWSGYARIVLVLAMIAFALDFARAPERVQRDTLAGVASRDIESVAGVIRPAPADQLTATAMAASSAIGTGVTRRDTLSTTM